MKGIKGASLNILGNFYSIKSVLKLDKGK